jgi:hypothetical protein
MSSSAVPVYGWVTEPPIVFVPWGEVAERVRVFQANLKDWGSVDGRTELAGRMNAHRGSASFIAELIEKKLSPPYTPVFEYRVAGQPIALMQFDMQGSGGMLEIKNVTTHPGSEGAGGIMVEYALNKVTSYNAQASNEMFEPGCLFLESLNDNSTAAYVALGFESAGKKDMVLNAAKSSKWAQADGKWRLVGKPTSYLSTS